MRFYLGFVLILALAIGGSAVATFADSGGPVTVAVTGGSLSESGPSSATVTPVTLNGNDQTTTYSLGLTVTDPRGTGAGWDLTITSTTFTCTCSTNNGPHSLATTASSINAAPSVSCNSGSSCSNQSANPTENPSNSITYPVGVPAAATAPPAVKLFDAALNTGMGQFIITPTVTISIPASAFAGTYTSTVTIAIANGP